MGIRFTSNDLKILPRQPSLFHGIANGLRENVSLPAIDSVLLFP